MLGKQAGLDQLANIQLAQGAAQTRVIADLGEHARGQQIGGEQQAGFKDVFGIGNADNQVAKVRDAGVGWPLCRRRPQSFAQAAAVGLIGAFTGPVLLQALGEDIQVTGAYRTYGVLGRGQGEARGRLRWLHRGPLGVADHRIAQGQNGHRALAGDKRAAGFGAVGFFCDLGKPVLHGRFPPTLKRPIRRRSLLTVWCNAEPWRSSKR
ncbi:hypothetical protein D3C76_1177030 [compost metagenome]